MNHKAKFLVGLICWAIILTATALAAPPDSGQVYIVQKGDWLSKIAQTYYGDPLAYSKIVAATNAKAAEDSSFTPIVNPGSIETGQKLWLPEVTTATLVSTTTVTTTAAISVDITALQQAYQQAVQDAATVEPTEISKNLVAITPDNTNLVWRGTGEQAQLLVLTWTAWDGYDKQVGQTLTTTRQTWVTTAPELKTFCTTYQTAQSQTLTLRLEQLLGLPPNNGKTRMVELWVKPTDLFRPAPDPEISDHEAELSFPTSPYFTVSADYQSWFNKLKSESYSAQGYPWTRLGYTYDWGNPQSEVGLSEFVVNTGAVIEIKGVTQTAEYCQ